MDMNDFLLNAQKYAPDFFINYCVINGAIIKLDEVQNMGCMEFGLRSRMNMPLKFYRYFRNIEEKDEHGKTVNYSKEALINNTVFLQSPTKFDDVYDSDISIDYPEYEKLRLIEYCRRCGISTDKSASTQEIGNALVEYLWKQFLNTGSLDNSFTVPSSSKIETLSNKAFILKVTLEYMKTKQFGVSVTKAIQDEYLDFIKQLKNTFRAVCFSTTPYSQLMWGGSYADCHKGFCIEYTALPNNTKYQEITNNLFPMIYCKVRPNMTERIAAFQDKVPTEELLWDLYFHGALRKSIDWIFQNEWRLLLPLRKENSKDYNMEFYPITKVFLGNRMPGDKRKEIIDICKDKNIPYIGVTRNPTLFEMRDCGCLCEECPRYLRGVNS